MEFVHRPYIPNRTIAAIATPPGDGGVAIIRISGRDAIAIGAKVFSGPVAHFTSHTLHYGKVHTLSGTVLDDTLLVVMRAPRSFTGEDTVEIQCHGGSLLCQKILEAVIEAGAAPADPGEFSMKAFLNGKLDLTQAEAIQAKIAARNDIALRCASQQLEGSLSKKISSLQDALMHTAAILEAWVDFPEEDLEFAPFEEVIETVQRAIDEMQKLATTFQAGKKIAQGVAVSLVGSPNVGKSSLMNALLGKERAIVSETPGTTRDLVEDDLSVHGVHLRLIDTAGIRETTEAIEEEGIRRSKKAIERADVVLLVLDVTRKCEKPLLDLPPHKTIAIWNKIDLPHDRPLPLLSFSHVVEVSSHTKVGLESLQDAINRIIWQEGTPHREEIVVTSLRHQEALVEAIGACSRVVDGLKQCASAEFVSYDMRCALQSLGTIIGSNITEEILTKVFSTFCIGK